MFLKKRQKKQKKMFIYAIHLYLCLIIAVPRPKKKKYSIFALFLEHLKQYCSNSSLHGLRYVGDPQLSIVER